MTQRSLWMFEKNYIKSANIRDKQKRPERRCPLNIFGSLFKHELKLNSFGL